MADEGGNGETFVTCQPAHTLRMAREVLMSVMLLVTFLYFLGVVYIFFTDAECNVRALLRKLHAHTPVTLCTHPLSQEVTEVWCHVVSFSALLTFIAVYCTRWGVDPDMLNAKRAGAYWPYVGSAAPARFRRPVLSSLQARHCMQHSGHQLAFSC